MDVSVGLWSLPKKKQKKENGKTRVEINKIEKKNAMKKSTKVKYLVLEKTTKIDLKQQQQQQQKNLTRKITGVGE